MDWESEDAPADALGLDSPVIQFSSNPGSPLQPLTKVASGGERARFALALKSVLAQVQSTPVVVLDEIDTGVSGEVASFMGAAMRAIAHSSQTAQVLSVTHLPQVAAQAEHHWEVRKSTDGTTTEVDVTALDGEGKLQAIATMLSASEVTTEALGQASQLMAAAQGH
jgi:DNA repair protein RecN (Recombination protein N)